VRDVLIEYRLYRVQTLMCICVCVYTLVCTYACVCTVYLLINYVLFLGPRYWGVMNPLWKLCSIGKRQSPIDIDPDKLLFDPFLKNFHIDKDKVNA